ncbi:MAG: hypothetical protein FJ279_36345 [Planctomycetes bacterium]|nr:hypothetical protein [Planctomycetota bacterium]
MNPKPLRDRLTRAAATTPLALVLIVGVLLAVFGRGREIGPSLPPPADPLHALKLYRPIYANDLDYAENIELQSPTVLTAGGTLALRYILTNRGPKVLRGLHVTIQFLALGKVVHQQDAYFDAVHVKPKGQFQVTVPVTTTRQFDGLQHLYRAILTDEG